MLAYADTTTGIPPVVCTLLWIAVVVLFIVGLLEAIPVTRFTGSRFGCLIAAVVALVLLVVLC
jgi:hypothetical protein